MLQAKGQKWTDFFHAWEDEFYNADIEGIDYKSLSVILLISSTTDTDLVEEFQTKDSPTTEELLQIATTDESTRQTTRTETSLPGHPLGHTTAA